MTAVNSTSMSNRSNVPGMVLMSCIVSRMTATAPVTKITVRLCLPFNLSPKVSLKQKNSEYVHRKSQAKFLIMYGYLITGNIDRITDKKSET